MRGVSAEQPGGRGQGQEAAGGVARGMPERRLRGAGPKRAGRGATASLQPRPSPEPRARRSVSALASLSLVPGIWF